VRRVNLDQILAHLLTNNTLPHWPWQSFDVHCNGRRRTYTHFWILFNTSM
jgi:hypothetical protein